MRYYQVLARRYRPKLFKEVLGQDPIIATLKNAVKSGHLAQAYLFSGSRGTGKTTTARILAKALNCDNLGDDQEPCNACSSCQQIAEGRSLDVLEIDGASNRGIEDIRQINETAGYSTSSGRYKIYIVDEVHMLTKEAFNALLKTLEEPPDKVKFFFATTESHKVPPTILSRCQRFNLNRIPNELITTKLKEIANDIGTKVQDEALLMIANRAEGGLRDAESLFDQVLSFHEGDITVEDVAAVLGLVSRDVYFEIDEAGKRGDLAKAFDCVHTVFSQGKDLLHFMEGLVDHFRTLSVVAVAGEKAPYLSLTESERVRYAESVNLYKKGQCMEIFEMLIEAQQQLRFAPSIPMMLESLILKIMRSHTKIPVDILVRKLSDLQAASGSAPPVPPPPAATIPSPPAPKKVEDAPPAQKKPEPPVKKTPAPTSPQADKPLVKETRQYDNLLQFAAVELEGKIQKK